MTIPTLVRWKRMPMRFLEKCPFCHRNEPETLEHLVFRCERWRHVRTQPHMAELIAEVQALGPNSALGFDQQHLSWILRGNCGECRVHGWMPGVPTGSPVHSEQDDQSLASTDDTGGRLEVPHLGTFALWNGTRQWLSPLLPAS